MDKNIKAALSIHRTFRQDLIPDQNNIEMLKALSKLTLGDFYTKDYRMKCTISYSSEELSGNKIEYNEQSLQELPDFKTKLIKLELRGDTMYVSDIHSELRHILFYYVASKLKPQIEYLKKRLDSAEKEEKEEKNRPWPFTRIRVLQDKSVFFCDKNYFCEYIGEFNDMGILSYFFRETGTNIVENVEGEIFVDRLQLNGICETMENFNFDKLNRVLNSIAVPY